MTDLAKRLAIRQSLPMPEADAALLRRYIHFADLELCHAVVALYGPGPALIMFDDAVSNWDIRIGQRKGSVLGRAQHLLKAAGVSSQGLPTMRRR